MITFDPPARPDSQGKWPLALVESAQVGLDGLTRTVVIRFQGRSYKRHVKGIMPLL